MSSIAAATFVTARAARDVRARASRRQRKSKRTAPAGGEETGDEVAAPSSSASATTDMNDALDDVEARVFDRADVARVPAPLDASKFDAIEAKNSALQPEARAASDARFAEARRREREDNRGAFDKALSVDSLLVFGCDGVLPELVNARVAMFGVLTGLVVEVTTGKSFVEQLGYNVTHGVSEAIVGAVILASCLPSFMAEADDVEVFGSGACKWKRDSTARAERGYLVDPLNLDVRTLPGKDTVIGRIGWVPFVELLNGRMAMITIIILFLGEGFAGHAFFTPP